MCLKKLNKTMVLLIASAVLLSLSPVLSYGFDGLGLNPKTAEKVSDSAMDDMRGKYYGFYFSINFSGYWDTLGSIPTAKLTYNAGSGKSYAAGSIQWTGTQDSNNTSSNNTSSDTSSGNSNPSASSASDSSSSSSSSSSNSSNEPAVKTTAVVGGLNGSGGVMQLTQVPGNMNFVQSGIVINLSIFNIKDAADSNLRSVLSSMTGL